MIDIHLFAFIINLLALLVTVFVILKVIDIYALNSRELKLVILFLLFLFLFNVVYTFVLFFFS